jgi:hypothetical protein
MMLAIACLTTLLTTAPQEPGADDFARQLAAILPAADELAWRSVPWRAEFRAALVEASQAGKPVLLWAMNGHPLGQT